MKKKSVLPIILLLFFVFSFSAFAESFEINVGSDYTAAYKDGDKEKISALLGIKSEELEKVFEEQNIQYFAVSDDKQIQIRLSVFENDLSAAVIDISTLDEDNLEEFAKSVAAENGYGFEEVNSKIYITFKSEHNDSGGKYSVSHYLTVTNGKIYQLSFYNPSDADESYIGEVLKDFKIKNENSGLKPLQTALIIGGIAIFAAAAVIIVISIIRDRKE